MWLGDISEHPTREGKLYICAIKDVWSNKIVGYSIDTRMRSSLARAAMRNAIALRSPIGTICHSDRGRSVSSEAYPEPAQGQRPGRVHGPVLRGWRQREHGELLQPPAEERPELPALGPRDDLRLAIVTWIETRYNHRRRQRGLGKLTTIEF